PREGPTACARRSGDAPCGSASPAPQRHLAQSLDIAARDIPDSTLGDYTPPEHTGPVASPPRHDAPCYALLPVPEFFFERGHIANTERSASLLEPRLVQRRPKVLIGQRSLEPVVLLLQLLELIPFTRLFHPQNPRQLIFPAILPQPTH